MARFTLTTPGEDATVGGDVDVIGTASPNEVITVTGGNIRFDPSFNLGGDTIDLPGRAEEYTAVRQGSNLVLTSAVNGVTITLPLGTAPNTLVFDNATRQVSVNGSNQLIIGTQVIDNPGGEVLDPGAVSFFQLTQNSDTDPQFTGTTGNDTYRADVVQTALLPIQTLTNGDNFNAGGGFDRLFAQVVNDVTPAGLINLEEIIFEGAGGFINPPATVNLVNADSLDVLSFNSLNNTLTVDNVLTSLSGINLSNMDGININIEFDGAALTAGGETLDLDLDDFDGDLDLSGDPGQVYTTINITSRGGSAANELDLDGGPAGAPNVNVLGESDLDLTGDVNSFNTLRAFDASDLDANLEADFDGNSGAAEVSVTGAQGDNLLFFNGTAGGLLTLTTADGADTVYINSRGGDVTADLGEGNNLFDVDGDVTGNFDVTSGDDGSEFRFGGASTIDGDVTLTAGDGDDEVRVDVVTGVIDISTGGGNDIVEFRADGGSTGLHSFGAGDSLDGGEGGDTAIFEATNTIGPVSSRNLFNGGTITNTEILRHVGDILGGFDLNADLDGVDNTATRLELAGTYTDDVNIFNMDGETVAALSSIPGELLLDNAVLTIDDYTVELGGSVTVGEIDLADHGPADEADRVTIISTGVGGNLVDDASQIDTDLLVLTGSQDLRLGRVDGAGSNSDELRAFDSSFGGTPTTIDATGASGDDIIALEGGVQLVDDGDGNDIYALFDTTSGDADEINFGGGSNAVWIFDAISSPGGTLAAHLVTGFDVTGAGADVVAIDHLGPQGTGDLFQTDGDIVVSGEAITIRNVQNGEVANLSASEVNFIKLTTAVTGATDVFTAVQAALGAGTITVDTAQAGTLEYVLASYYDNDLDAMVVIDLASFDATITGASGGNAYAVIEMTYDEYLAFDADNLVLSNLVGDVQDQLDDNDAGAIAAPAEMAAPAADFGAMSHSMKFAVVDHTNHIV